VPYSKNHRMHQPCQEEPVCLLDLADSFPSPKWTSQWRFGVVSFSKSASAGEFDAISSDSSSILPYHKAGKTQGWHGRRDSYRTRLGSLA
jgi:hypothetical protein